MSDEVKTCKDCKYFTADGLFEKCAFAIEENAERWIGVHLDLNELEKVLKGGQE